MEQVEFQRVQPQNIEAEQSVLGCMLLDEEAVISVVGFLKGSDFYRNAHEEIFNAMAFLFETAQPIDLITVSERLSVMDKLDSIGGIEYLTRLSNIVPSTSNAKHYAKIVEEKSMLRTLIRETSDVINISYDANESFEHIFDKAEKSVFDILSKKETDGLTHVRDIVDGAIEKIEEVYNNKGTLNGVHTGFEALDEKLVGLYNSDLIIVAARPGVGKSAFSINIVQNVAIKGGKPCAIFNFEMSKEQVVNRILSSESKVKGEKIKSGNLEVSDWGDLAEAKLAIAKADIYIDDNPVSTVAEIKAKCRKLKLENGLGLVVIDYLQLMEGDTKHTNNRQEQIAGIARSLKIMAKELNVPVIALSQLGRGPELRSNHRPMLSDLRESGSLEQDADIVMFLYDDEKYDENSENRGIIEVIIEKHRNGETGKVELAWLKDIQRFGDRTGKSEEGK